jgi:hypothetical protein
MQEKNYMQENIETNLIHNQSPSKILLKIIKYFLNHVQEITTILQLKNLIEFFKKYVPPFEKYYICSKI